MLAAIAGLLLWYRIATCRVRLRTGPFSSAETSCRRLFLTERCGRLFSLRNDLSRALSDLNWEDFCREIYFLFLHLVVFSKPG